MILSGRRKANEDAQLLTALSKSLAVIEFDPKGKILSANENFCRTLGYAAQEIVGKHHAMFVDPHHAQSAEYREFWAKLGRGEFDAREFKRIGKGGKEVWIEASYNPVLDARGKVLRVVKVASDVTAQKLKGAEFEAKLNAISASQAVIEFTPSGEIVTANPNFLTTMGYALDEIVGRHHRIFVDPAYANSPDYQAFWAKLNHGEYVSDMFRRVAKGGRLVQLQASYNPIFDMNGRVTKVVKFASDLSDLLELGAALGRLANSDLSQPIPGQFKPMFAEVQRDFNVALEGLRNAMTGVAGSVEGVASGAKQIATASDNLSSRTEQQAASLEQTAAALNTVTDTVNKTAAGSAEVSRVVASARTHASNGGQVVRKAVEAMDRINKSSNQIGQIIGVIDEIAFQTNLLALNAGVEAARAGDAGRGFAVVASEVRGLAQRSADAAKEIKQLVSTSTAQVGDGVNLVAESGKALVEITEQIEAIAAQIAVITSGTQEQSTSLKEVNVAMNQLDQGTQQNAAMAEEASAAVQSLMLEAERLGSLVGQFRLAGTDTHRHLRAELKRVAPHAFAKAPPPRPVAQAARKLVNASASSAKGADWAEF